jgi:hypothetical protein
LDVSWILVRVFHVPVSAIDNVVYGNLLHAVYGFPVLVGMGVGSKACCGNSGNVFVLANQSGPVRDYLDVGAFCEQGRICGYQK